MNRQAKAIAATVCIVSMLFVASSVAVQAAGKLPSGSIDLQTALDGTGMGQHETNLGDLVADAARQEGSTDLALIAADEVSDTNLSAGQTPIQKVVDALSYASDSTDTIVVLKLTGAQLMQVLEWSVSRAPQSFDGFLQVSGLKLQYDPSKPEGSRVTQVVVGAAPLDNTQSYTVATTRPVADGSFGYFRFWGKNDIVQDTHISIASSLADYLNSHRSLNVTLENRILP